MRDTSGGKPLHKAPDFSFVQGGLFIQLLRWTHLSDDIRTNVRRPVIVIALLAWLPLLVFSALEGQMLGGTVAVPFVYDVDVHIRLLLALPLLIIAEVATLNRLPLLLQQFTVRHLVPEKSMARFEAVVASAMRLRISVFAEVLLIAVVYGVGILVVWRHYWTLDTATWYATPSAEGSKLTLAGMWYGYVSMPIAQFLLLRWYWRMFVWARLLWQVSRIELSLVPAHPDRVGGLGFLASAWSAFAMLAAAHGALAAGQITSRILFAGATLLQFKYEIAVVVVFMLCIVIGPLLFFAPQLAAAKLVGMRKYGALAARYVREFDAKWLNDGATANEALVGSADIQSLADLGNSYEMMRTMSFTPISMRATLGLAAATLAPIAPLLLTMIPLNELLGILMKLVF
ncbi:MAG TPA: hypothetical protein VMJ33_09230 [Gallionella sp.]|nr:hypothetical protein [Gallionella sp.]